MIEKIKLKENVIANGNLSISAPDIFGTVIAMLEKLNEVIDVLNKKEV